MKERNKENNRKYIALNPNRVRETARRWRKNNPDRVHAHKIKATYGIDGECFARMFEAQGRRCACCHGVNKRGKNWHIDHEHTTNEIRGILCGTCNVGIGALGDNLAGVLNAVSYLGGVDAERVDEHY